MNNNSHHNTAHSIYDVAVIGGGVNGTAIARDAAGRGHKVVLLEAGDLGAATSSASTKLIHGGLRYLEYGELRLVKKALIEREVFLKSAPHIVWPMRFVLPLTASARPAWMIKMGLALYDHLARRDVIPSAEHLKSPEHVFRRILRDGVTDCFAYSDCWVDDARLVVLQAMDAQRQGADIMVRTGVQTLSPVPQGWAIQTNTGQHLAARMVVNATGPWVRQFLDQNKLTQNNTPNVRLVRGSHIIVPALYEGEQSYLLQQPDGRVVFAIPYEEKFTLVGTTDVEHIGGADVQPMCTPEEAAYLCDAVNRYFINQITTTQILFSYSGVRPLFDDGKGKPAAVTRDYHLHISTHEGQKIMSVFGGKITTARALAEHATNKIQDIIGYKAGAWTSQGILPGGDMVESDFPEFLGDMAAVYTWFEAENLYRYARCYGTYLTRILGHKIKIEQLGQNFGGGLFEAEVNYLINNEWARTADDILWRRTKLGLHVTPETVMALKRYLGE
jgi:glycerol-3-phosphate dehydrogenase